MPAAKCYLEEGRAEHLLLEWLQLSDAEEVTPRHQMQKHFQLPQWLTTGDLAPQGREKFQRRCELNVHPQHPSANSLCVFLLWFHMKMLLYGRSAVQNEGRVVGTLVTPREWGCSG